MMDDCQRNAIPKLLGKLSECRIRPLLNQLSLHKF